MTVFTTLEHHENPVALIKRFGIMLLSTRKMPELFSRTGETIQELVPGGILVINRKTTTALKLSWQSGLDRCLNKIYTKLHGDPLHMAFPLPKETPEQQAAVRDNKLHHFKKGLHDPSLCSIPERLAPILEELFDISDGYTIGFAWGKVHYGTLSILLPKGVRLENKDGIETIVLLASGAMMRLEIEDDIRQSEAKYRTLVEESHEAIGMSRGNRVLYANTSLVKLLGYDSAEELIRAPLLDHIAPESRETILTRMQRRDQNARVPSELEYKVIRKDGTIRTVTITSRDIMFKGEKCIQTSFHDMTDKRHPADSTARIEKLESIGILAGSVAHEFNNLFMAILGRVENAKTKIGNISAIRNLNHALEILDRARELTSRLVTFSSGGIPELQYAPLFPFVEEVIRMETDHSEFSCSIRKAPSLRECLYDRNQLRRVLHTLINNAFEAMPSGGPIKVSAGNLDLAKGNAVGLPEGNYVQLSIADHGTGIPKEFLPQIFNPFFTTKPGGTGLSLAVALAAIKRHGGTIVAKSLYGKGATFHVYLQARPKDARMKDLPAEAEAQAGEG